MIEDMTQLAIIYTPGTSGAMNGKNCKPFSNCTINWLSINILVTLGKYAVKKQLALLTIIPPSLNCRNTLPESLKKYSVPNTSQ